MSLKNNIDKSKQLTQTNSVILKQILRNKSDKTGWVELPPVTLSFDNGTRTFTITPTGSSFEYWIQGQKFIKYAAETVIIADTEGIWYIYYVLGTLTASQSEWDISLDNKAFVAIIHWDDTNNIEIGKGYELHGFLMHAATHEWAHETIGTRYEDGFAISLGAGGDIGKVGITGGELHDEDIEISITGGAGGSLWEQVLTLPAQIPVFYRNSSAAWRKYAAGDYPFYDNSGGDNIHYNLDTTGSWSSQAASGSNKYIAMWIYGTNEINEPIIAIMGQNEQNTIALARVNNTLDGLSFGTLPFSEMKILHRLILRTDGSTIESLDLRATSNLPGGTFVPTSHGSLSGLAGDDHTHYLLADGTRNLSGSITFGTGVVITSADEDLNFIFGRAFIGVDGINADSPIFAHRDHTNSSSFGLRHHSNGDTYLNAVANTFHRIGNVNKMIMNASVLTMSVPIAMGGNDISSSGALSLKVSGDNDDYLEFYTASDTPKIKIIGGNILDLEADGGEPLIRCINGSNYAFFKWDESAGATKIQSSHLINIYPNGDTDDYIQFSTTADVPKIEFVGGNGLITNVADPTDAQDVATKKYVDEASEAAIHALLGIDIANKRWINCILEGSMTTAGLDTWDYHTNVGAEDVILIFGIPLPMTIQDGVKTYNLVITDTKIGVKDANGSNYIDHYYLYGWSAFGTRATLVDDGTNLIVPQEQVYAHADMTLGGTYERGVLVFNSVCANANALDISYVEVEYYYVEV